MATTHDAQDIQAAKQEIVQEIIDELDQLNLGQLRQVLALINAWQHSPPVGEEPDLATRMQHLRDDLQITQQEFEEFDRILRAADEAEKRRLEHPVHE